MSGALIGVDWGTTNLRAFRFGADGAVLETRRANAGVASIADRAFEATLRSVIADWLASGARVIISGMAGSREGWIEAPYLRCPADLNALAAALVPAPATFGEAWIVPGLVAPRNDAIREIMRGEETQIFGALAEASPSLVIAPGTHSKWARVTDGRVLDTRTYMTGELFALLRSRSILARLIDGDEHDAEAFARGARRSLADPALLNLLFTTRSDALFGALEPRGGASYLSGLLIGAEIAEGFAAHKPTGDAAILVVGAAELAGLYQGALGLAGFTAVTTRDGERAAARGLWRLAQAKGLT